MSTPITSASQQAEVWLAAGSQNVGLTTLRGTRESASCKRKRDQAKLGPDIVRAERAVVERLERHRALEARVAALRKEEAK